MAGKGRVYAIDKDPKRLATLKLLTGRAGCDKVIVPIASSFLDLAPGDYPDVEYILLDPSCSGSGIVGRLDHLVEDADDAEENAVDERLESLAAFQRQALLHAFSFPSVKRVVYSTCSIHPAENEEVVKAVLRENAEWRTVACFADWQRRGILDEGEVPVDYDPAHLVRTLPSQDATIGFFVCLFERKTQVNK
jgi:putative methyltransferase